MDYYNILNINRNSDYSKIRASYRQLAKKYHPDKGGDENIFKNISEAYRILSDPELKQDYDIFGICEQNNNNNSKGLTYSFNIYVKLEDIYNGSTVDIELTKKNINYDTIKICSSCNGSGYKVNNFNIFTLNKSRCDTCNGEKYIYDIIKETTIHNIKIPQGFPNKGKIILENKGDDIPYGLSGDIEIIINEKQHKYFERYGLNLFYKMNISLIDCLCGCEFDIKHLNKTNLIVKTNTDEIITQYNNNNFNKKKWQKYNNTYITLEYIATADIDNYEQIIKSLESGNLKNKNVTAFYIKEGKTYFYNLDNINLINKNKKKCTQSVLYIYKKKNISLYCIENEGMFDSNNNIKGDLYILFNIIYPKKISNKLKSDLLTSELATHQSRSKYLNENSSIIYPIKKNILYENYLYYKEDL